MAKKTATKKRAAIVLVVSSRDGDATARQHHRAEAVRAAVIALTPPGDAPQTGASPQADVTCEHGTAMDVHCCHCHSGFIFDANHECPASELTWREAVEQALGVESDPENHTPSWAFDVVRAAREIGNAPTPASPQAEPPTCQWRFTGAYFSGCGQEMLSTSPDPEEFKHCPYCGKPLVLVPAKENT